MEHKTFDVQFGDKVGAGFRVTETVDVKIDGYNAGQMVRDKSKRSWKSLYHTDQWVACERLQSFIQGQIKLGYHLATAKKVVKDAVAMSIYF